MSGLLRTPSVAIVTSRLRRLVTRDEPWLAGLRGALRQIAAEGTRLVVADGTAGSDFVRHAATRLAIPLNQIAVPNNDERSDDLPRCDRAVVETADVVYVLQLRANGNVHRLLRERVAQRRGGIILVDLPGLQTDSVRRELGLGGAVTWRPSEDECRPFACVDGLVSGHHNNSISAHGGVYSIVPFPSAERWDFLVHTTRACSGPWPNQSFEQYADSLMESRRDADHSTLSALQRIVTQKKLIASSRTIRGGSRVVSLTACPLLNLPALHRFRPHRVRWDFEPFGLCLRREWLMRHGVRPVQYGDDATWESLSDAERPFFQLAMGDSGIDWTVEEEWRGLGDLRLEELTPDDVILFVPDFESAKSLAEVTPWPVTLWPGIDDSDKPDCNV